MWEISATSTCSPALVLSQKGLWILGAFILTHPQLCKHVQSHCQCATYTKAFTTYYLLFAHTVAVKVIFAKCLGHCSRPSSVDMYSNNAAAVRLLLNKLCVCIYVHVWPTIKSHDCGWLPTVCSPHPCTLDWDSWQQTAPGSTIVKKGSCT